MADMMKIGLDSQRIIAMRLAGLAGLRPSHPTEKVVMVTEKARAAAESAGAITRAALSGAGPQAIIAGALKPYAKRTRANVKRLSKTPTRKG